MAINEVNIAPFLTSLASFESWQSQLSIGAKLAKNGVMLTSFMAIFWFFGFFFQNSKLHRPNPKNVAYYDFRHIIWCYKESKQKDGEEQDELDKTYKTFSEALENVRKDQEVRSETRIQILKCTKSVN